MQLVLSAVLHPYCRYSVVVEKNVLPWIQAPIKIDAPSFSSNGRSRGRVGKIAEFHFSALNHSIISPL